MTTHPPCPYNAPIGAPKASGRWLLDAVLRQARGGKRP